MTGARARLVVCGDPSRGDDGAARAALARLGGRLPDDVETRLVTGLDPTDVLDAAGLDLVVADTVVGVTPGELWVRELRDICGARGPGETGPGENGTSPRFPSTHTLSLPDTLALAWALDGRAPSGWLVAIGGRDFALGSPLSPPVSAQLDTFGARILELLRAVKEDA